MPPNVTSPPRTARGARIAAAAAIACAMAGPSPVRAIPPPTTTPQEGRLVGLVTADAHGLTLVRESFRAQFDGRGRCQVELRYELRSSGSEQVTTVAAYLAGGLPATRASVEGAPDAARPLTDYERGAIESTLESRGLAAMLADRRLSWRGLAITADPGQTVTVVVRSELLTERTVDPVELFIPAIRERHLVLGPDQISFRAERVHVPTAPTALWGTAREVVIESRAPEGFSADVSPEGRTARSGDGRVAVSRARGEPPAELVAGASLQARFPSVSLGGPYIGLGGEVDDGFRLRAGVEIGLGRYLVASANVDTSFDGTWVLAPVIEAATPAIILIPSLALGAGPAFRFDHGASRAGVRIQGTLHLLLGFVVCVDVYPAAGASGGFTETTLLGTVGL